MRPTLLSAAILVLVSFVFACGGPPDPEPPPDAGATDSGTPAQGLTRLAFRVQPGLTTAGEVIAPVIEVALQDASGELVSTASATISLRLTGGSSGATLLGTTSAEAVEGVARFDSLAIRKAGEGYSLVASAEGFTTIVSEPFTVAPAALGGLALTSLPESVAAGTSQTLRVTVIDVFDNRATNWTGSLELSASDAQAVLPAALAFGAADEGAKSFSFQLRTAGPQSLTVALAGSNVSSSRETLVTAGAAKQLRFETHPSNVEVRAILPTLDVALEDAFGNSVETPHTVTLKLAGSSPGAVLGGSVSQQSLGGSARFTSVYVPHEGLGYALEAHVDSVPPATSNTFDVSDTTSPAVVGDLLITDSQTTSVTLSWTAPGDDGTEGAASSYVFKYATSPIDTEAAFQAAQTATTSLPALAGQTEALTLTGLSPATTYFAALRAIDSAGNFSTSNNLSFSTPSGTPDSLGFTSHPSNTTAGTTLPTITVALRDAQGATLTTSSATVSLSLVDALGDSVALVGTTTRDAVNGVATFTGLSVETARSGLHLEATSGALPVASSNSFDVAPAAPAALQLTAPGTVSAGSPEVASVRAVDAFDNVVWGYAGTVELASSDPNATLPEPYTFAPVDQGEHAFAFSLPLAGSTTLTVSDAAQGLTSSATITVLPAAFATLSFTSPPPAQSSVRAGFATTVSAHDAQGNVVSDFTGTVTLTLLHPSNTEPLLGTSSVALANGVAAFTGLSIASNAAGYTLLASLVELPGEGETVSTAFDIIDDVAPAAPTLTATELGYTSITLSWSAVGDDGAEGQAFQHDLRYSTSPIVTESDFANASIVALPLPPQEAQSVEEYEATGLSGDTLYYFALAVSDDAGNVTKAYVSASTSATDPCAGVSCADPAPTCDTDGKTLITSTASCRAVNGSPTCVSESTSSVCPGVCGAGACHDLVVPQAGQLAINEVMHSPSVGTTEYIELENTSDDYLDLRPLKLTVGSQNFTMDVGPDQLVYVAPGEYFVFGGSGDVSTNGGVAVDFSWGSTLALTGSDTLVLSVETTTIASLSWGLSFPQTPGRSMSLAEIVSGTPAASRSWYWCDASSQLTGGDFGTPGSANGSCGIQFAAPIDWCNQQSPTTATVAQFEGQTVYGRVYEPGLTDRNLGGNDEYPHLFSEFGYGSDAAAPAGWTWTAASLNAGYTPPSTHEGEDEVMVSLEFPTAGTFHSGFRHRAFDPATETYSPWTYCDQNGVAAADGAGATWGSFTVESVLADHVVISEVAVAGPGGPSDEFIELYNPTDVAVDLSGWKLQYRSAAGTAFGTGITLPPGASIPAHGYYLATGSTYSSAVTSNLMWGAAISMSGSAGHVRLGLPAMTTALVDANAVDLLGWGATASGAEGNSPVVGTWTSSGSFERKALPGSTASTLEGGSDALRGNGRDSDENAADFVIRGVRGPQNTSAAAEMP